LFLAVLFIGHCFVGVCFYLEWDFVVPFYHQLFFLFGIIFVLAIFPTLVLSSIILFQKIRKTKRIQPDINQ